MKKNITIIIAIAIVSSLAVGCVGCDSKSPKWAKKPRLLAKKAKSLARVEAYYYFGPEERIKDYLESLKVKYKDLIKIEYIDLFSKEGEERWKRIGIPYPGIPGILINGRNKFNVFVNNQVREVEFVKSREVESVKAVMDVGSWTKKDLEAALEQEMGLRRYPEQVFELVTPK